MGFLLEGGGRIPIQNLAGVAESLLVVAEVALDLGGLEESFGGAFVVFREKDGGREVAIESGVGEFEALTAFVGHEVPLWPIDVQLAEAVPGVVGAGERREDPGGGQGFPVGSANVFAHGVELLRQIERFFGPAEPDEGDGGEAGDLGGRRGIGGGEFVQLGLEIENALGGRVVFGEGKSVEVGEGGGGGTGVNDPDVRKVPIPMLRELFGVARRRIGEGVAEGRRERERDLFDAVGGGVDLDPAGADLLRDADAIAAHSENFALLAFAVLVEDDVGAGGCCEG